MNSLLNFYIFYEAPYAIRAEENYVACFQYFLEEVGLKRLFRHADRVVNNVINVNTSCSQLFTGYCPIADELLRQRMIFTDLVQMTISNLICTTIASVDDQYLPVFDQCSYSRGHSYSLMLSINLLVHLLKSFKQRSASVGIV